MAPADQQHDLLHAYEGLLACSERMLAAAREADWEQLIECQGDYLAQVEVLKQIDEAQAHLDAAELEQKAVLLERLLEQDREIRQRLRDRRDELSALIKGARQQRALSRSYAFYQDISEIVEAAQRFSTS